MAVYVDDARITQKMDNCDKPFVMCHMMADTPEELHAAASALGISRKWCQGTYYNISQTKKALALQNGAISVSVRQMLEMHVRNRSRNTVL